MNLLSELYRKLQKVPALIQHAELRLAMLDRLEESLSQHLNLHRAPKPVEPTTVYVLPPTSLMMAQSAKVTPGGSQSLVFTSYRPLEAGAWIVSVGPADVRQVIIGNQCQSSINYQGTICQTKDVVPLGVQLRVDLAAPRP